MPGSRLIGNARKEKARKAYNLHIKRYTNMEIAKELGIGKNLVAALLKEEMDEVALERDGSERAQAIGTLEAVIKESFRRLERMNDRSLNVAGLIYAIISAPMAIDDITGVSRPKIELVMLMPPSRASLLASMAFTSLR